MYQEILRNNDEKTYSYDREQLFLSKTAAVILSTTDRKMAENEKWEVMILKEIRRENDIC